jgi:cell wall-associated NlpC family hydrolase
MTDPTATHALAACRAVHAPDPRTACFDLEIEVAGAAVDGAEVDGSGAEGADAEGAAQEEAAAPEAAAEETAATEIDAEGAGVALSGAVSNRCLLAAAREAVADATNRPAGTDGVTVLADLRAGYTVAEGAVPVRSDPARDAEQVTAALYGAKLRGFDSDGDWLRVRTPDGYLGWLAREAATDARSIAADAVVTAPEPRPDDGPVLYAGTDCEILEAGADAVRASFRTGDEQILPSGAVVTEPTPTGAAVVATAEQFEGTPYEWGGMTVDGIDCSGLAWVAYRTAGVPLPRDSDQQRRVGREVGRDELRPGDLLFFPGHVAISTGGAGFVHAYGDADGVVSNSLDPASEEYLPALDESFALARRVIEA